MSLQVRRESEEKASLKKNNNYNRCSIVRLTKALLRNRVSILKSVKFPLQSKLWVDEPQF